MTHLHIIDDDMTPPPKDGFSATDFTDLVTAKQQRAGEAAPIQRAEFRQFEARVKSAVDNIDRNIDKLARIVGDIATVQQEMRDLQRIDTELASRIDTLSRQVATISEATTRALERLESEFAAQIKEHSKAGKAASASIERWRNRLWIVGVAAPVAGSIAVAVGTDWVKGLIAR